MNHIFPEQVQFNIPFLLLLILAAVAWLGSYWLYKSTVPRISAPKVVLLGTLRALVLFLVFVLLFAPRLTLWLSSLPPQRVAVFIDNSASMNIENDLEKRWTGVREVIRQLKNIGSPVRMDWFAFNQQSSTAVADSIKPSASGTNLSLPLKIIRQNGYDAAVLVSDGIQTEGILPMSLQLSGNTKIYTIGVGKKSSAPDVFIANVEASPLIYSGKVQQLVVRIGKKNLTGNQLLNCSLVLNGRRLASTAVEADTTRSFTEVEFSQVPSRAGLQRLTVELDPVPGEIHRENNTFTVVQQVLKSRLKITLFQSRPNWDGKFTAMLLRQNPDFELLSFVEVRGGSYLGKPSFNALDSADVVILLDYPGPFTREQNWQRIVKAIRSRRPGVIVFSGADIDWQRLKYLADDLPVSASVKRDVPRELSVRPAGQMDGNPIANLFESQGLNEAFWNNLPPLEVYSTYQVVKKNGRLIMAAGTRGNTEPVGLTFQKPGWKSMFLNGASFWRWHFLLQDQPEISEGLSRLLTVAVRWASVRSNLNPVQLLVPQSTVFLGKKVELEGFLFDGDYNPISDGYIDLEVSWQDQQFKLEMTSDSAGSYSAQFIPPGRGRYVLSATGFRNGLNLGQDRQEIEVIPFDRELIVTDINEDLLKGIATENGGQYFSAEQTAGLVELLNRKPPRVIRQKMVEIWHLPALLMAIILLISLEWILRKRFGLV